MNVEERRARLVRRHCLATRAPTVEDAARAVVCLHATDPTTVYLSAWARTQDMAVADLDRALYDDRTLIKHLAMRRTLFVFPRELLPVAQAGASQRVAEAETRRLIRDVEKAGLRKDGARWLKQAQKAVLEALADGREASSSELKAEIKLLDGAITMGEGKSWGGPVPVAPRVLTTLSAAGKIVRASNAGAWTTSRPRWGAIDIPELPVEDGVRRMVEHYLRAFGPATALDIKWWLGSTKTAVKKALGELDVAETDAGFVMADDTGPEPRPDPSAALLPPLDPTTMGWFERDWYLGAHRPLIFDSNGNAGPTAWWDGRIVGGWRQHENGDVELQLLEGPGSEATAALEAEAARLSDFFAGTKVLPRFPSPLMKAPS